MRYVWKRRFIASASALVCASSVAIGPGRGAPTAADFEATRDRPLFSPTRRPPPAAPPPLAVLAPSPVFAPPPAPPPNLTLSGIIVGGGTATAIVRRPTDASATHVALGSEVDGWTVDEIHPRSVVLRRADRTVTLDLPVPR